MFKFQVRSTETIHNVESWMGANQNRPESQQKQIGNSPEPSDGRSATASLCS